MTQRPLCVPRNRHSLMLRAGRRCTLALLGMVTLAMSFAHGAAVPRIGGQITGAMFERIASSPFPASPDFLTRALAAACYEGLTRLDGDGQVVPGIASEWFTEDQRIWRFQIALEAPFHDGTPIRAEHVQRAWEETLRTYGMSLLSWPLWMVEGTQDFLQGRSPHLSGVHVMSPGRLEVRLTLPFPAFPEALAYPSAWVALKRNDRWIGSGPFAISRWDPERVQFQANRSYRWGRPYLDALTFSYHPEVERERVRFEYEAGTLSMIWDAAEGKPLETWVALLLNAGRFEPTLREGIRHGIEVGELLRLRALTEGGSLRFVGEPLQVPPGWRPYRPYKAARLVRKLALPPEALYALRAFSLPGGSGPAIARALERQLGAIGLRFRVVPPESGLIADASLIALPLREGLLSQIPSTEGMVPCLLLYRDAWRMRISPRLHGWRSAAGAPIWDLLWMNDE